MKDPFQIWFEALEKKYLNELKFSEIRRALQALSALYVEKRGQRSFQKALEGKGKRAAFALYYGAMHFLQVRHVVRALGARGSIERIIDLGCGIGSAGIAWALELPSKPQIIGYDRHPWAVKETRWTYQVLGLKGKALRGNMENVILPGKNSGVVLAFTANELDESQRQILFIKLITSAKKGASILVVEPISRRVTPWWSQWSRVFQELGGRDDDWRFTVPLPETLKLLDKAAGLDHQQLTCRSLWLPGK